MNQQLKNIVDALLADKCPQLSDVMHSLECYPVFTLPAAAILRHNPPELDDATRRRLTVAVSLSASDPARLYQLLDSEREAYANFYPTETKPQVSTESAIDTFLQTYGTTSPEEEELLNRLIFNPTPDYSQLLAQEEEQSVPQIGDAPAGSPDDLLNRFIVSRKKSDGVIPDPQNAPVAACAPDRHSDVPPQPTPDTSLLSESLAKIFIKQRHYQRAYEIISQLSLNYPEKSVYFADQLRFLRKLIVINSTKANQNQQKQ